MRIKLKQVIPILGVAGIGTFALLGNAQPVELPPQADRFEVRIPQSLPEAGEAKVEMIRSRPEVRFKKWNGEVNLGVRYAKVQGAGVQVGNRTEWRGAKEEVHAYPIDDENFEIEVVLKEKPDTNVFEFQIDGAEDLDFFYQPELTQDEIDEGASRPENVVGSYAVYHKTKANHRVGSINYATGKAFHIYRPKAIDANGVEEWAELLYDSGVLSVTVPQSFLDEAVYPVRVDPTFGYTTIGGTGSNIGEDTIRLSSTWAAPENGIVEKLTVYLGDNSVTLVTFRPVIYINSTDALVTFGAEFETNIDNSWVDSVLTDSSITDAINYDFGIWVKNNGGTVNTLFDVGTHSFRRANETYHATNNPPDPFVEVSVIVSRDYSIYATYTAETEQTSTTIFKSTTTIKSSATIK